MAEIDQRLSKQVEELEKQSKRIADLSIEGTETEEETWLLGDKGEWDGDIFEIEKMGKAFDRKELNDKFTKTIDKSSNKSTGEKLAQRLTGDLLMAMERAFRLRHASQVRCSLFAAGRSDGHGDGGLTKITVSYVQDLDKAGQGG